MTFTKRRGDPSWNSGPARESCPHTSIPRGLGGHGLSHEGILKGLLSFFPPKAGAKAVGSSTIPSALQLSSHSSCFPLSCRDRVERCGNDLQTWYGGL